MTNKIYYVSEIRNILGGNKADFHLLDIIKIEPEETERKHKLLETLSDAVAWFYEHKLEESPSPYDWLVEANSYFTKHIIPLIIEHKKGELEGTYWAPAHKYKIGQMLKQIHEDCIPTNIFNAKIK